MSKWEYALLRATSTDYVLTSSLGEEIHNANVHDHEQLIFILNKLGHKGYELVRPPASPGEGTYYYFKRPML